MNTHIKLPLLGSTRLLRLWAGLLWILLIAAPAPAQHTMLKIVTTPKDPTGQGTTEVLGLADATFTASKDWDSVGGAIYIGVTRNGRNTGWRLAFRAPLNGPLTPGVYTDVALWSSFGSTEPELSVLKQEGDAPWKGSGRFEIKKVVYGYGPDREIKAFWATFEQSSNQTSASVSGEIRYNADSTEVTTNQGPRVLAHSEKIVALGDNLEIRALVRDDGLPAPAALSAQWTRLSGPGAVTFEDEHSLRTTAQFSAPGRYSLRLEVSDGEKGHHSDIDILAVDPRRPTLLRASLGDGADEGFGQQLQIDLFNGEVIPRSWDFGERQMVKFEYTSGATTAELEFYSAQGTQLAPGRYEYITGKHSNGPVYYYSGLHDHYWQPEPGAGDSTRRAFEIYELGRSDSGGISRFWAAVEIQRSAFVQPHLFEVRFNASEASAENRPPLVSAGQDLTFPRNAIVRLRGNALDSSLPEGILHPTLQWSKISGPGEVTFADAAAPQTNVTFSTPGVYVCRLSASDGTLTSADDITVTIIDGESGFFQRTQQLLRPNSVQVMTPGEYFFHGTVSADRKSVTVYVGKAGSKVSSESVTFHAPAGQVLKPGFYPVASSTGYPSSGYPSYDYAVIDSNLIERSQGSLDVKELEIGEDGSLQALRVVFGLRSAESRDLGPAAFQGEIRFNARLTQTTPNQPPLVQASSNVVVQPETTLRLHASLVDDVQPFATNLSVQWEQVDGPRAPITDSDFLVSEVHLRKPGTYRFRITASDTELTDDSMITVVVSKRTERFQGLLSIQGVPVGEISIVLTRGNYFTGRIRLEGKTTVVRGRLANGIYFEKVLRQADGTPLSVIVRRSIDGIQLGGRIGSSWPAVTFEAQQDVEGFLKADGKKVEERGLYTLTFSPETSNGPGGAGFGSLKVTPYGSWRAALRLADGTATLTSGSIAVDGTASLFAELYRRKGWLAGKLKVTQVNPTVAAITGPLAWRRPPAESGPFAEGFAQILSTKGMRYLPAVRDPFGTGGAAATLQFRFTSSWAEPLDASIHLPARSLSGTSQNGTPAEIRFAPGTGAFSGHFQNAAGERQPFSGALLQGIGAGLGHFLTPSGSGHVELIRQ